MSRVVSLSTSRITTEKMSPRLRKEVAAVRSELKKDYKADYKALQEAHPEDAKDRLWFAITYGMDLNDYFKDLFKERVLELTEREKGDIAFQSKFKIHFK